MGKGERDREANNQAGRRRRPKTSPFFRPIVGLMAVFGFVDIFVFLKKKGKKRAQETGCAGVMLLVLPGPSIGSEAKGARAKR